MYIYIYIVCHRNPIISASSDLTLRLGLSIVLKNCSEFIHLSVQDYFENIGCKNVFSSKYWWTKEGKKVEN